MFPQTELENYKLQVELLQEKLQRSEISRQQLEHKLDKILQKRDEHDKAVRSKSRQKYQQFLEEQQRRNERNKQLVQMLERIEQQTAAMNARSERLKMMKLQYEMYFAKLVHSQTRRCIQSSAASMTTAPMMGSTLPKPVAEGMMIPSTLAEGLSYGSVYNDPPLLVNNHQRNPEYVTDCDQFAHRPQREPTLSPKVMEISTPDYAMNSERSEYFNMRKHDLYEIPQTITNRSNRNFVDNRPLSNNSMAPPNERKFFSNKSEINTSQQPPYTPCFSIINKQTLEMDIPTTASSSSTVPMFHTLSNVDTESNEADFKRPFDPNDGNKNFAKDVLKNINEISTVSQPSTENSTLTNRPNLDGSSSELSFNFNKDILQVSKSPDLQQEIQHQIETKLPEEHVDNMQSTNNEIQAEVNSNINDNTTTKSTDLGQLTKTQLSLENIENAIYGELVNPPKETPLPQNILPSVAPEFLENLIVLPTDSVEINVASLESTEEEPKYDKPEENNANYENVAPEEETPRTAENKNYVPALDYSSNGENLSAHDIPNNASDYTDYENNNSNLDDNAQQEQQYDYTNYDPSQYSYPGYIYDEATGEYKPDPDATDQQYTEGYDQQYQQEGYDYNQAYDQQDLQSGAGDSAYENYDDTEQVQPSPTSNTTPEESPTSPQEQQSVKGPVVESVSEIPAPVPADLLEVPIKNTKPTSILSTAEKNDQQKKKKRVNFVDSSETDESSVDKGATQAASKTTTGNESDFDFSSSSEAGAKNV